MMGKLHLSFSRIGMDCVVILSALLLGISPGWTQTGNVSAVTLSQEELNATPTPSVGQAPIPSLKVSPLPGIRPEMVVPPGEGPDLREIELKNIETKELELKDMFD